MQTNFSLTQLADPKLAEAEGILRKCVHCGFCTATCPTYVTLGNELDSPRGRIYLIKDMLENGRAADEEVVTHIDRCLSCLACTTTCPSGVDYMHLVDHARAHIEKTYRRPLADRLMRALLAFVLPFPRRLRLALQLAPLGRLLMPVFRASKALRPLAAMLDLAPKRLPDARREDVRPSGPPKGRVALLKGCAQTVLDPGINAAAQRLLTRFGIEVVTVEGEGCCGSLTHHMGREEAALDFARRNIDAWCREIEARGLDAILITTSGCGTTIKDYAHMLRQDAAYAEKAAKVAALARDITEYLAVLDLPELPQRPLTVAYHAACSLQHGQKITAIPKQVLQRAGFRVREPAASHLCCGSAGTYNILQPEIAGQLKERKLRSLAALKPDVIVAGNIGCLTQIGSGTQTPVLHSVELLDWAYGGETPVKLRDL
ncbi:glycolate oxidase subunit GlcF [Rhizobium paknamense]|uniref:Glycolate oxidase iron-sulfur subunit n=1 Tax=Rhizobium paknamense TaxID=1206817 RepID=A0ABU0IBW7_9HYPH|nr:glycolate oxidase subunit GlcF [Rhizobium paknamense]MDQ0454955.1 glycolate oxidase iron-sulfur subunit [Rhizobium paknamense]